MPFDQKRINGPETSFSYEDFIEKAEDADPVKLAEKRVDGRLANEHRKFGETFIIARLDLILLKSCHFSSQV